MAVCRLGNDVDSDNAPLLKEDYLKVTELSIVGFNCVVTESLCAEVSELFPNVNKLRVIGVKFIRNKPVLLSFEHLQALFITYTNGFSFRFLKHFDELRRADCGSATDDVTLLSQAQRLRQVKISNVSIQNFDFIADTIEYIWLHKTKILGEARLINKPALWDFVAYGCTWSQPPFFAHLPRIDRLDLSRNKGIDRLDIFDDVGVTCLEIADIGTIKSLKPLIEIEKLERLEAAGVTLEDDDVSVLTQLPELSWCTLARKYKAKVSEYPELAKKCRFSDRGFY